MSKKAWKGCKNSIDIHLQLTQHCHCYALIWISLPHLGVRRRVFNLRFPPFLPRAFVSPADCNQSTGLGKIISQNTIPIIFQIPLEWAVARNSAQNDPNRFHLTQQGWISHCACLPVCPLPPGNVSFMDWRHSNPHPRTFVFPPRSALPAPTLPTQALPIHPSLSQYQIVSNG